MNWWRRLRFEMSDRDMKMLLAGMLFGMALLVVGILLGGLT